MIINKITKHVYIPAFKGNEKAPMVASYLVGTLSGVMLLNTVQKNDYFEKERSAK